MLRQRFPHITFVWIMGADSFASLTRWNHWRKIIHMVAIAVRAPTGSNVRCPSRQNGAKVKTFTQTGAMCADPGAAGCARVGFPYDAA